MKPLQKDLIYHLDNARRRKTGVKAIICPHAGYHYCAATAAWSWIQLDSTQIDLVFVLGPSHHIYLSSCALPQRNVVAYSTPTGDIPLDKVVINELRETRKFEEFDLRADEDEHSLEMQLPFLHHIMNGHPYKLVPIVVGDLSLTLMEEYGKLLLPFFEDERTLFVISSDFCHWGTRYRYNYIHPRCRNVPIFKSIETLDLEAIRLIEAHDLKGFLHYLQRHKNTICGRNPICILLQILGFDSINGYTTELLHYSQSQEIIHPTESSVSYAALCTTYSK
ncbi:Memo family protein [Cardiosporidium cionae]|uniref:Memo family protein n=1 Tax=Cardiosporidium cionae TaxID=476202 RepID=A0ABQ7J5G7_9APIC|nr:Memo family protein [Cardiosporidium cionae]|eukprot:KAF8819203.1 Memo family protein [Cardiosporidium cionae]